MQTLAETTTAAVQSPFWLYAAIGLIATGVLIILVILASFWTRSRSGSPPLTDMPAAGPATGTVKEAERLLRLMGEAEEQASRLSQELAARAERLEALIQAADERLGAAARAQPASPGPGPGARVVTRPVEIPPAPVFAGAPDPTIPQSSAAARAALDAQALRDQLLAIEARLNAVPGMAPASAPVAPAAARGAPSAPVAQPGPRPAQVDGSSETIAQSIYRLADQGLSAAQIAQHLGQQTGTIELFLALRQA